jgi:hypothetical protein
MGLINLLTDLNSFYQNNPYSQQYAGGSQYATPPAAIAKGSFDQKSLKYGNDQRGGGSSNQPYIVTPIPDGFGDTAPDFLLRNGYLNPLSSTQDVSRLTKLFLDTKSPNGLLFITKQQLLERQNVEIPGGFNRIYNPLGTLAQAGVVSTGYHLNKQGFNPFARGYFNGGDSGYYLNNIPRSTNEEGSQRLISLYEIKQAKTKDLVSGTFDSTFYNISSNPNLLISYDGGPGSFLGVGKTNIRIQNPTRTVVPKEKATKSYKSLYIDNEDYLIPSGPFTINWNYKPTKDPYLVGFGASGKFYLRKLSDLDFSYRNVSDLYTDDVLNLLNRNTSTVIPIGKLANTFNKNTGKLKSEPGYLVPKGVEGNITYQTFLTGLSNEFEIAAGVRNLDYENKAKTTVGNLFNSSSLRRPSYHNHKSFGAVIIPNLTSFQTASIAAGLTPDSSNDILKNLKQTLPARQTFGSGSTTIKKAGTTTLGNLNPQYNPYKNSDGSTVNVPPPYPNIKDFNREDTYGTMPTVYRSSRTRINNDTIKTDGINDTYVLQKTNNDSKITEYRQKDLVKFYFEINNNNALTDTQNMFLFFRAYINDLGDSYKPDWSPYKYVGRAENFYKYAGFSRDISLSFTIYAHSREEMLPIYEKLNYLVGTTAPDYSNAGYMRGNFVNLTVGDYLNDVPGIITSINLKPSFEAGWDLNRDVEGNIISSGNFLVGQLPRMIDIDLGFTPIHSFVPKFGEKFIKNIPTPQELERGLTLQAIRFQSDDNPDDLLPP